MVHRKSYKLRSRALWKYVTGEATAPADNASSEDKEKYALGESQAFWLIYESVGLERATSVTFIWSVMFVHMFTIES